MAYPDKINALVDVTADQTLAAGGHAARHNDVNDALEEVRDFLTAGAWTTYTPAVSQGVSITTSTTEGRYFRLGSLVIARVRLICSSSGTAGSLISVGMPISASPVYGIFGVSGSGIIYQAASSTQHVVALHSAGNTVQFVSDITGGGNFGQQGSFQLVSGDYISFTATYEVAP